MEIYKLAKVTFVWNLIFDLPCLTATESLCDVTLICLYHMTLMFCDSMNIEVVLKGYKMDRIILE